MVYESGTFSARRSRETLGGIQNNGSAIPMPSSALKRSNSASNQAPHTGGPHSRSLSGSRMSLAPSRPPQPVFQRSSSGNNLAEGFASANRDSTRASIFGGGNAGSSRKSFAPGGVMATPAHTTGAFNLDQNTQRRSSVYRGRPSASSGFMSAGGQQQSFFATAPAAAALPQDPRRLRDAGTRQMMAQELMEYLTRGNFEMDMKHSLSHKSMSSPTQKDFNCMFQWLYHRIDPAYKFQKNIDAEVPPLLKQMRYPFEKSIMKSQIAAVGGNNWSTFLGLLHWMMQLAKIMEAYSHGSYDDASFEAGHDVQGDRIIFDFLSGAYSDWLQTDDGDDDDDPDKLIRPHVETMAARFDAANEQYVEQVKMLEAEHKALQDQIDELSKAGPKIAKLDEQIKILEDDKVKFEQYNNSMEARVEKYQNRVKVLEEETVKAESELEEAETEKSSLQDAVDRQGISIQDIDRMNAEHERLKKSIEQTNAKLEESRKKASEREAEASNKLEELERLVERYNTLAYQIALVPSTAANAKGNDYELVLNINDSPANFRSSQLGASQQGAAQESGDRLLAENGSAYQPHQILNLDLRGAVRNNIAALRKEVSDRRNAALEADMANHDLLDKIKEAMDDKQAEVEALGHRVRAAEEELEKTREITTAQKMASDTQIEKMERELSRMRAELSENTQLIEQRELNTNLEYEQLTLKAAALREEMHTEIERMLNDIIKFKVHVQKSLEDYEQFVADQVEREYEEQEQGEQEPEEPEPEPEE